MKILKILALLLMCPMIGNAADASFSVTGGGDKTIIGNLANEGGLAYNRNYYLNAGALGAEKISVVIAYSTATFADVVFSTPAITMGTGNIASTAHGLQTAVPVLLSETAGTLPAPLAAETTYYAIRVSADIVQLATTSAQAVTLDEIVFISSTTDATQTYTLAALAITGDPIFAYSASNDGSNFYTLSVSSTIGGFNGVQTWAYDFSDFNYSVLKLAVTSPTAGGVTFQAVANIKK